MQKTRAQKSLSLDEESYQDLYEQAPVGYVTLSDHGLIVRVNHTAVSLLGVDRGALVNQPISRFVLAADQHIFSLFHQQLKTKDKPRSVELRMVRAGSSAAPFWVRLDGTTTLEGDNDGPPVFRVVMSDVDEKKQIEEVLLFLAQQNGPGDRFLEVLVRCLAEVLGMDFCCIVTLEDEGLNLQAKAVYPKGALEGNWDLLKDIPGGEVTGKAVCCYPANVCQLFPQNELFKDLGAESYVGVTLWSNSGQLIGLISLIGRQPLANKSLAEEALKLVVARAASELERLSMGDALRKSEESYRLQFAKNSSVMFMIDPEGGRIIDANAAAQAFYGYSREQLLAMRATDINTLTASEVQALMTSVIEERGSHFEFQHRLADGSVRDVEVSSSRIQLGECCVLHSIVHDTTKRKKAERELQKHYETYQDILSTTLDGFWLVDFQGNILDVNDSYIRQSGYSREELLRMRPNDLDIHETAADTADRIRQMIESGQTIFETIHRRKDGSTWHVEISVGVCNGAGGQFVGFLRDITARKMVDEQLRRSLQEKEVLLKEIHHRVKNNLQVIHSILSLQSKRVAEPTTRLMIDESLNRVCSMALIHERLYRSENLSCIDFKGYLQSLVDAISVTYHCPNVTCVVAMEPLYLDVNVGVPCGLIANELVSNSLKHAFPDGRKGTITVGIWTNNHGDNVLAVKDDGIGCAPEVAFGNSLSLGLQIVNGLTAQLHGTITHSTDRGFNIRITFPRTANQPGATYEQASN